MELVTFKSIPGATDRAMFRAANKVTPVLASLTGFISREFGKTVKTDEWVDTVMWESLEDALNAAKNVTSNPAFQPFYSLIAPASIQMRHVLVA